MEHHKGLLSCSLLSFGCESSPYLVCRAALPSGRLSCLLPFRLLTFTHPNKLLTGKNIWQWFHSHKTLSNVLKQNEASIELLCAQPQSLVLSLCEVWSGCVFSLSHQGFILPSAILSTAPHRNQNSFLPTRRWRQSWKIKDPKWNSTCYPVLTVQMTYWVLCSHGNLQEAGQFQEFVFSSLLKSGWR